MGEDNQERSSKNVAERTRIANEVYAVLVALLVEGLPMMAMTGQFTSTVFFADASTSRYDVFVPRGEEWDVGVSAFTGAPILVFAKPSLDSAGEIPPSGCGENSDQDNHMIVLDLDGRCEYDFRRMRLGDGAWVASWANAIGMDSTGICPAGMSTRGSGFAFLGGVIQPDELDAGHIGHALSISIPGTRRGGPVAPATDSDVWWDDPAAIPAGAREGVALLLPVRNSTIPRSTKNQRF